MKEIVIAGAMALALAAQAGPQQSAGTLPDAPQQAAQQPQQPQQQNAIPDAPRPQTTGIGPVTPGKAPALPNNESGSGLAADPEQPEVGTSLPAGQKQMPDDEQDVDPIVPANSQDFAKNPQTYKLPGLSTNLVEIPFTVKDSKGRPVPGIGPKEVHVYENNVRQKMLVFTVDPHPLSIALVIDQSMPYDVMTRVNNALGALQGAFTPYDEVAVFTYNNGPKMLTDFTGGQSARLVAAVERSKAPGRESTYYSSGPMSQAININDGAQRNITPLSSSAAVGTPQGLSAATVPRDVHTLNDAIMMAAQATAKAGPGRRRIVYVISDGKEYGSTAKTKDVIKYLQTNKVEVVATLVGDASVAGMGFIDTIHLPLMMRDNVLPTYTAATGGQFYADYRTKGIEQSFAKITEDVRTQYTVWYNSREPLIDGKFRTVEVRVLRPNLQVIAKKGYWPSMQDVARPQTVPVSAPRPPQATRPATVPQP